jgi:hypothetical protein
LCHMCPLSNSTLAESRQYYLLPLCASNITVMPDGRVDGAGHITVKQNEQRRYGTDWCKGRRTYCTKYNTTRCIHCFTSYHK